MTEQNFDGVVENTNDSIANVVNTESGGGSYWGNKRKEKEFFNICEDDIDPNIFKIDRNALDIEWERQASTVYIIGRMSADARLLFEDLKRQLELKKADAYSAIKRDPDKYGLGKVTEVALANCVIQLPEIAELIDKVNHAQRRVLLCKAAVDALESKKKALEGLTDLIQVGYFSAK